MNVIVLQHKTKYVFDSFQCEKEKSKSKNKTLSQEVMIKARAESINLKRELHGLLQVQ